MGQTSKGSYESLLNIYQEFVALRDSSAALQWDQYVTMPEGGRTVRNKQLSAVSSASQDKIADSNVGILLEDVAEDALTDEESAVVREIRREHERATRETPAVDEDVAELAANAHPAWNDARDEDDFSAFAPHLEAIVEKKRTYATALDSDVEPYEALVEDSVPELDYETIERILLRVKDELVPLLERIRESEADLDTTAVHGDYDDDEQLAIARELLDVLGFDWDRGRLDTFDMPGTFGFPSDARICTWTDESLYQTLYGTAHECGHALYAQGLPDEKYGSPLGEERGVIMQESQAALWENRVFAHRAFWDRFWPTVTDRFDIDATAREAYESVNYVREQNPIWVEADELTGQIHILLRFEIERDLINGEITVDEIPKVWNDRVEEYFGVRPETLEDGCLQDIHWAQENFGYFPTYTLGNVLAAQLTAALERDCGDIGTVIRNGNIETILEWNREHVHQHGKRYTTSELVRRITGTELSADDFVAYTTAKYADLYDL